MSGGCKTFLVRIYDGSDIMSSFQNRSLELALQRFQYFKNYLNHGISVVIERMSNLDVRDKYKHIHKLSQIIDWLVEDSDEAHVDVYFLPCHLHQGYKSWHVSMMDLKEEYKRLGIHGNGCPDGYQISCPVDVMYNEFENRMVVNEIESIQACYEMRAYADKWYDEQVDNSLVEYYVDQFKKLVVQKIETMLIDGKITDSDN